MHPPFLPPACLLEPTVCADTPHPHPHPTVPAVELVMGQSHVLNGNEIAIDRATPKEKAALLPGRLRCGRGATWFACKLFF